MLRMRCLLGLALALALASPFVAATAQTTDEPARIVVKLPPGAEKATLTFGTYATKTMGLERNFITPPLPPGKAFHYEVTVLWKVGDKEYQYKEKASVSAGKLTTVDFTKAGTGKLDDTKKKDDTKKTDDTKKDDTKKIDDTKKDDTKKDDTKKDDTKKTAQHDWPQWLGPHREGSTAEKVMPWKNELKKAWSHPVGEGHSSPVVADGRVFLHYVLADKEIEAVDARDAKSGDLLWHKEYPRKEFKTMFGRGPRSTPAVAGGKLYTFGATGILTCFDVKNGKEHWQVDTQKLLNPPALKFGIATSPLVIGDEVILDIGAKGASVVAFDKDDGKIVWKALDDGASYASPIVFGHGKDKQIVTLTHKGVVGLELKEGKLLWKFPFQDKLAESSTTPVHVGDKLLASSITLGSVLLEFASEDGKIAAKQVWLNKELTCYFSTPVVVGKDQIYLVTGALALSPSATLHCVDPATGKSLWTKGNVGQYHASLIRTGDSKVLMMEESGNLVLIDPNTKEYHELCRSKVCGKTWAHPAIAGGRLYIRDEKQLVCVELGQ